MKITKLIVSILVSVISFNVMALPGKQEFIVQYGDGELRFINDGRRMVVLEMTSAGQMTTQKNVKCGVVPLENYSAKFGDNNIMFYQDMAVVNERQYFYESNKTDLLFYNDICPKLPKQKKNK
jgi:hypothetical protein